MKIGSFSFFLCLILSATILYIHALPNANLEKPQFAPDKIIIRLTEAAYKHTNIPEEMYAEAVSFNIEELDDLLTELGVTKIIRAHRKVKDTAWEKQTGFDRWFLLTVPDGTDIRKAIAFLKTNQFIDNAIPEYYAYLDYIPNDQYYPYNWGHNNTAQYCCQEPGEGVGLVGFDSNAEAAWNDTQGLGTASVVIAILDTGVDLTHPDLRLVPGYDFGDNDPDPSDNSNSPGHGTCCAGIAAAKGNNVIGVTGIAAGCSVMPLKVADYNGNLEWTYITNALTYAADNGADIISMSFGTSLDFAAIPTTDIAIRYAYNQGLVLFGSSGNSNMQKFDYCPASHPCVIAVGAASPCGSKKSTVSCDGEYWWGSNWGPDIQDDPAAVDVMAPTILPTTDIMGAGGYTANDYHMQFNGTSCSCPYAAGVAALLLSKYPSLTPAEVRMILTSTATDMTIDGGEGWDMYTGYGLVNASAALSFHPNVWNGTYSSNWSDSRNWNYGVPTSNDNIQIFPVSAGNYYPEINTANAYCKNLYIASGAAVTITDFNLTITENLKVYGNLLQNGTGDLTVNGFVQWCNGSTSNMTNAGSEMFVKGHMYFLPGSDIQMTNGTIEFFGDNSSGIYVNETARMFNLRSNKNVGSFLGTSPTSDHDLYIHGNFTNMTDRVFKHQYPGTIHLKGSFVNNILGAFWFTDGTISFDGSSNQSFTNNSTLICYFNNVIIATSNNATFSLNEDIEVRGSLTIDSGVLQSNNYTICLEGNWNNNVGEAAFIEGDGALVLNGTGNQYLINEHFGTIDLNKTSGEMIIPEGSVVTCDKYNWTAGVYRVSGGTFTVAMRLVQPGIFGSIYLDSGTINYHQDEFTRNDFNGTLYINGGAFNVYGGSDDCYWAGTASAALYMTDGVFDFKEKSIIISNPVTVLTLGIQGGTIRTNKGFFCTLSNVNFNAGTLEFYGMGDGFLELNSACHLYNLLINKGPSRAEEIRVADIPGDKSDHRNDRQEGVTLNSHITLLGTLNVNQGFLNTVAWDVTAQSGISVSGIIKKSTGGSIITYGDFIWQNGSVSDFSAGTITCGGNWRFLSGCTVDLSLVTTTLNAPQPVELVASSPNAWFGILNFSGSALSHFTFSYGSSETLIIKGVCTISGGCKVSFIGRPVRLDNNLNVGDYSTLHLGPETVLSIASGKALSVYLYAFLETLGTAGSPVLITHQTGYYALNINNLGTIRAQHTIFEYMNTNGVNCIQGSYVDATYSFHNCTFRNGAAGGTLLILNCRQSINVIGANFPTNTWSGASNVSRTMSVIYTQVMTFTNSTGNFSGEAYDNDANNRINWVNLPCDLIINDFWTISNSVYVCEENSYGVEISNTSVNPTGLPVRVDIYYNRETMPPAGEIGDQYIYIDPLPGGESYSFETLAVPSSVPAIWKTWFRVDGLNEIDESNNDNNADGYVQTQWLPLPVVTAPAINLNLITNRVELTWTYPSHLVTVNRYKIYRAIYDDDPFTELAGTSTTTNWSEPLTEPHWLYRIVAEKDMP